MDAPRSAPEYHPPSLEPSWGRFGIAELAHLPQYPAHPGEEQFEETLEPQQFVSKRQATEPLPTRRVLPEDRLGWSR